MTASVCRRVGQFCRQINSAVESVEHIGSAATIMCLARLTLPGLLLFCSQ